MKEYIYGYLIRPKGLTLFSESNGSTSSQNFGSASVLHPPEEYMGLCLQFNDVKVYSKEQN